MASLIRRSISVLPALVLAGCAGTASPSPSPSAAAIVPTPATSHATPTAIATPTLTPAATPAASSSLPAEPVGPTHRLEAGGWATVTVERLNVRSQPVLASTSTGRLVEGAVVHVAEGPERGPDGYDWYRIASLGGATGWIASGTEAEPFATMLTSDGDLLRCGRVESPVLRLEGGEITAVDPFHIGELALPAAAFADNELGAFELLRSTGGEACIVATVNPDGTPSVEAEVGYYACGQPVEDGEPFRLRPAPGMDVITDYQVKETVLVHPAVLTYSGADDVMARNINALVRLMARGGGTGCISHGIHVSLSGRGGVEVDGRACGLVETATSNQVVVRPDGGDTSVTFLLEPGSFDPGTPLGVTVGLYVDVHDAVNARQMGIRVDPSTRC